MSKALWNYLFLKSLLEIKLSVHAIVLVIQYICLYSFKKSMFGKIDLIMYLCVTKRNWETISETTLPEHENKPNIYLIKQWFTYYSCFQICISNPLVEWMTFRYKGCPRSEKQIARAFRSSKATARIALSWMGPQRPKRKKERRPCV